MDESAELDTSEQEKALERLKEIVLDHLGLPRPKQCAHIQALQDKLLPAFVAMARRVHHSGSPMTLPSDPVYKDLSNDCEVHSGDVRDLNSLLEELGVHGLLRDVGDSPDVSMVEAIPYDPYEERLLREAGHHRPQKAIQDFLRFAAKHPQILTDSDGELERGAEQLLGAHKALNSLLHQKASLLPPVKGKEPPDPKPPIPEKPKKSKLFSGLGKLTSGLVLLSGNAIVIPTVTMGSIVALPVLGSLAAGIAAVGEGIGQLRGEGE